MKAIILSRSDNVHADKVQKILSENFFVVRNNFDFIDGYPKINCSNFSINDEFDLIFIHHPSVSSKEKFVDDIDYKIFISTWRSYVDWVEYSTNSVIVNKPSACKNTQNILRQLIIANKNGLRVPKTIFTNSIKNLRESFENSKFVIKQGNLGLNLGNKRILTNLIKLEDIDENLLCCPCFFQEYIEKKYELRVHVIGEEVLVCKIESQKTQKTKIDWRNYNLTKTPHSKFHLKKIHRDRCISVVKELGLVFGTIDLIMTPKDELVFLECNSQGHWLWIEKMTGLPITQRLCEHMVRMVKNKSS